VLAISRVSLLAARSGPVTVSRVGSTVRRAGGLGNGGPLVCDGAHGGRDGDVLGRDVAVGAVGDGGSALANSVGRGRVHGRGCPTALDPAGRGRGRGAGHGAHGGGNGNGLGGNVAVGAVGDRRGARRYCICGARVDGRGGQLNGARDNRDWRRGYRNRARQDQRRRDRCGGSGRARRA